MASKRKHQHKSGTSGAQSGGPAVGLMNSRSWATSALAMIPLFALPLILNLRLMQMPLPNEQPKWAVLLIAGMGLAYALAVQLWRQERPRAIRISWPGLFLGIFYLLLMIGISIGPNWVEGAIRFAFWASALAVWLAVIRAMREEPAFLDWLAWATSIAGFIFSLHYWWSYVLEYGTPGYNISVLFSPVGQINFTGDVLVILVPVLLWLLAGRRELAVRMMCWFAAVTCGAILLVAASRGAIYGLVIGVVVMMALVWRHRSVVVAQSRRLVWILLASALISAVVVYQMLPYHFRELARVSATFTGGKEVSVAPARSTQGSATGKQAAHRPSVAAERSVAGVKDENPVQQQLVQPPLASLWRRLSPLIGSERAAMYASSAAMIAETPWLGQGTGNFPYMYPKQSNRFPEFRDVLFSSATSYTTNPHNIFLQIASQNGLPAAAVFMGLLALFLLRLAASLWRRWDGHVAAGVVAVTAAIFEAMFNQLFFNPASMFVFALFAGAWYAGLPVGRSLFSVPFGGRVQAASVALLALLMLVWPVRWLASDRYVQKGLLSEPYLAAMAPNYRQAEWLDPYNFRAVYGRAKVAFMRRDYAAVIARLEWLREIYPYNAAALNMLGVAYMLQGRLVEAEQSILASLAVLPDYGKAQENIRRLQQRIKRGQKR